MAILLNLVKSCNEHLFEKCYNCPRMVSLGNNCLKVFQNAQLRYCNHTSSIMYTFYATVMPKVRVVVAFHSHAG